MEGSGAGPAPATVALEGVEFERVAFEGVAFERAAATAEALRVREAGVAAAEQAGELVAALDAAAAAASGVQAGGDGAGGGGGLVTGPVLAECAALLARRVRDAARAAEVIAAEMTRAAGLLEDADEEVARHVAGAAG